MIAFGGQVTVLKASQGAQTPSSTDVKERAQQSIVITTSATTKQQTHLASKGCRR